MKEKILFITVPEASVTKNLLRGTFWQHLTVGGDLKIVLITPPDKAEEYRNEFAKEGVTVEVIPPLPSPLFIRIAVFLGRNALKTGTTTMNQMRQYFDGGHIAMLILKRLVWYLLGRQKWLAALLRSLELIQGPHPQVKNIFDRYRPALLFSTVAIHAELDVPLLREAKRRKIKTVGMLRGWDNFTTHGYLRVVPDKIFLQNQYLKEVGIKHQFLPREIMEVVGFPQNDWYFQNDLIIPRAEFFQRLGIDPQKRMILFGAMGDYLFPREGEIAEVFEELVESGKIPWDLVMVFRAHPSFPSPLEKMKGMKHVVPERNARYRSLKTLEWEMGKPELAHLINSIVHSEMVITSGSTMALDAVALGKPAISAAFEKAPTDYWISARRFRHHYTHYEAMMATGGVMAADSPEELAAAINGYLKDPSRDEKGRKHLREQFLEPYDGHSGERIAALIKQHFEL